MPLFLRRLLLWATPVALLTTVPLAVQQVESSATLSEAWALLVADEVKAAEALFRTQHADRAAAQIGLWAAAALRPQASNGYLTARAKHSDSHQAPFALTTRRAFERGRIDAALRLTALAEDLGQQTVPAVTTAALIETGRLVEAKRVWRPTTAHRQGRLARHVAETLALTDLEGMVVRDRRGRLIGLLRPDGTLNLAAGIDPQLIPPAALTQLAALVPTKGLRLSIDLELSALARAAFGSFRGSIVLLAPHSGEVLAAVSDRQTFEKGGTAAFEQLREPASISKLITAVAAQRAGIDPDVALGAMTCGGHRRYDGQPLYCPHVIGALRGLNHALAVSCNVAFADLGVRVGRARMLAELRRFGFDRTEPFAGARIEQANGDDRQLADLAIGLEATAVTPLHAARIAAVMANDGIMPDATLLSATDGYLGLHPRPFRRQPGYQVMESAWLPQILAAMKAVTGPRATAQGLAPRSFPVAMKTGTASHPLYGFHVNYIGVGPLPAPRLAFAVRITDQPTSRRVRAAAREVTARLLSHLGQVANARGWHESTPSSGWRAEPQRLAAR